MNPDEIEKNRERLNKMSHRATVAFARRQPSSEYKTTHVSDMVVTESMHPESRLYIITVSGAMNLGEAEEAVGKTLFPRLRPTILSTPPCETPSGD